MEKMVELRNVHKRFGDFVAVGGVNLEIAAGEFLTLLGPSGCGKTTLLRMISGFETPTEGAVYLAGRDVTSEPPYRRDVNQVFQSYALFPHLRVWDNVAFGLKMKKTPAPELRQRVERAIELVSLRGFEDRKPAQLSGGQKQRVALARALVCEPKVLLLDEPLAALDAKLRRGMQVEIKRLQARLGITFVFVTHDQEEALVMSDRIAVVNQGRIEQIGAVREIYHSPATPFVADFIGQANVFEATIAACEDATAIAACGGGHRVTIPIDPASNVSPPIPSKVGEEILLCIRPEKIRLHEAPNGAANLWPAAVAERIFRGATDQLLLTLEGGLELTVLSLGARSSPGDRVWVELHPSDLVVLPRKRDN